MKKLLLLTIIAVSAIIFSAKAQTNYGYPDIKVEGYINTFPVYNKMSIAGNGWIYVISHYKLLFGGEWRYRIFCSKDEGRTFQKIIEHSPPEGAKIQDIELIVTGNTENDLVIHLLVLYNYPTENKALLKLTRHRADGTTFAMPINKLVYDFEYYDAAISSNHRAPVRSSLDNPFAVSLAVTGYNSSHNISYVYYYWSINGGISYESKTIYSRLGSETIGKVDVSIGTPGTAENYPRVGIVFEEKYNALTQICFLANRINYYSDYSWEQPIRKSYDNVSVAQPKIQWTCSINGTATTGGEQKDNFVILLHPMNTSGTGDHLYGLFPRSTFKIAKDHTPSINDLAITVIDVVDHYECESAISYDPVNDNYLVAFVAKSKTTNYFKLFHASCLRDRLIYLNWSRDKIFAERQSETGGFYTPAIDINPAKDNQAAWTWMEHAPATISFRNIWFDREWPFTTTGVDNIQADQHGLVILPNPVTDMAVLQVNRSDRYTATLYNLQGKQVKTFTFTGTEHTFSVQDIPKGIYLLNLSATAGSYKAKLIVK